VLPGSRLAVSLASLAARAMRALWSGCRPSGVAGGFIADLTRSRAELLTENALLRQQLVVASRAIKRPTFRVHERGLLVLIASVHRQWCRALLRVRPETVLRRHWEGFRLFWRRRSRSSGPREPRVAPHVVALIHRMACDNRLWGAGGAPSSGAASFSVERKDRAVAEGPVSPGAPGSSAAFVARGRRRERSHVGRRYGVSRGRSGWNPRASTVRTGSRASPRCFGGDARRNGWRARPCPFGQADADATNPRRLEPRDLLKNPPRSGYGTPREAVRRRNGWARYKPSGSIHRKDGDRPALRRAFSGPVKPGRSSADAVTAALTSSEEAFSIAPVSTPRGCAGALRTQPHFRVSMDHSAGTTPFAGTYLQSVVEILHGSERTGLGFFLTPRLVITCAHVVLDCASQLRIRIAGHERDVRVIDIQAERDVAFLRLDTTFDGLSVRPLVLDGRSHQGVSAQFVGWIPDESGPMLHATRVEGVKAVDLQGTGTRVDLYGISDDVWPGYSGGPAVIEGTRLVCGMVVARDRKRQRAMLVPGQVLIDCLRALMGRVEGDSAPWSTGQREFLVHETLGSAPISPSGGGSAGPDALVRQRLIRRVRNDWIEPVLERSLYRLARLQLGLASRPELLDQPWDLLVQRPGAPPQVLPPATRIAAVFYDFQQSLLILGSPGSGKTTLLLELARDLLYRAEDEPGTPVPLVFHLSTWAIHRGPLDKWLADEMQKRYDLAAQMAKAWIADRRAIALLDGLDEVSGSLRDRCVDEINAYHKVGGGLVVCSRESDYELLDRRLHLCGAVSIQPLTPAQVDSCLASVGQSVVAVREALQRSDDLRSAIDTPLMLAIAMLGSEENLPLPLNGPAQDIRREIVGRYVDSMFQRAAHLRSTKRSPRLAKDNVLRWLAWLASTMKSRNQSVFYLGWVQPSWLGNRWAVVQYRLGVAAIAALIAALVFDGVVAAQMKATGAVATITDYAGIGVFFGAIAAVMVSVRRRWVAAAAGASIPVVLRALMPLKTLSDAESVVLASIFSTFVVWVAVLLVGNDGTIRPAGYTKWSLRQARSGLPRAARIGAWVGAAACLVADVAYLIGHGTEAFASPTRWLESAVVVALFLLSTLGGAAAGAISATVIALLLGGFSKVETPTAARPESEMRRSVFTACLASLLTFGVAMLGARLIPNHNVWVSVWVGLIAGGVLGLRFGGLAVLQHYVLRSVLVLRRLAPWPYVRLLEHAGDLLLMQRVGSGYLFVHATVRDYLASQVRGNAPELLGEDGVATSEPRWRPVQVVGLVATVVVGGALGEVVARTRSAEDARRFARSVDLETTVFSPAYFDQMGMAPVQRETATRVLENLERVAKGDPDEVSMATVARLQLELSQTMMTLDDDQDATDLSDGAYLRALKALQDSQKGTPSYDELAATALVAGMYHGWSLFNHGELDAGDDVINRMTSLSREYDSSRASPQVLFGLASCEWLQSRRLADRGLKAEASAHGVSARDLAERASSAPDAPRDIANVHWWTMPYSAEKDPTADQRLKRSCDDARDRLANRPLGRRALERVVNCGLNDAYDAARHGDAAKSDATIASAANTLEFGLKIEPDSGELRLLETRLDLVRADIADVRGQMNESVRIRLAAAKTFNRALKGHSLAERETSQIRSLYGGIASAEVHISESDGYRTIEAQTALWSELREAVQHVRDAFPHAPSYAYVDGDSSTHLGELLMSDHRSNEAEPMLSDAVTAFTDGQIMERETGFSEDTATVCRAWHDKVRVLAEDDKLGEATHAYDGLQQRCGSALDKYPWDYPLRVYVKEAAFAIGKAYNAKERYQEAMAPLTYASNWGIKDASSLLADMYEEGRSVPVDANRAAQLRSLASRQSTLRFTVPADFDGVSAPVYVYINEYADGIGVDGIDDQVRWLKEARGGTFSNDVVDSFRKLLNLARANKVGYPAITEYAFNPKNRNASNSAK
jgi:hypothetical protein